MPRRRPRLRGGDAVRRSILQRGTPCVARCTPPRRRRMPRLPRDYFAAAAAARADKIDAICLSLILRGRHKRCSLDFSLSGLFRLARARHSARPHAVALLFRLRATLHTGAPLVAAAVPLRRRGDHHGAYQYFGDASLAAMPRARGFFPADGAPYFYSGSHGWVFRPMISGSIP